MESVTKSKLTSAQVESLVKKHFPEAHSLHIEELTEGMFNTAYLIHGEGVLPEGMVLKIGPGPEAKTLTYEKDILRTEIEVYQLLQDKPIPLPALLAFDYSREDVPCDYFFMECLQGQTWKSYGEELPSEARPALMRELGAYNAVIHSVEGQWFGYLKKDTHYQYTSWGQAFGGMMNDILNDGRASGYELPYQEIEDVIQKHLTLLNAIARPQLVNFDMWAGNVFLKEDSGLKISGILDLERSFYGDPYADFTSAMSIFWDVEQEADFCAGYSEVSSSPLTVTEDDRIRMNLYRLYMAVILYVETYRYDPEYAAHAQGFSMKYILSMLEKL